jgi:phosphinothricin acetyltransferase
MQKKVMSDILIRRATVEDAEAIWQIYRYYVECTAISFEITMPEREEIQRRIQKTLSAYPYLIAEEKGKVLGYAYAGPFIPREAYAHCAEVSIYLDKDHRQSGLGRRLYEEMFCCLKEMGIRNVYACIGVPEQEDAYLTDNSARFHAHMGFQEVGRFRNSGYKFGRYYHMIWMEFLLEK